ncbi:MAG: N-acetylmuramoyl-L-alanine amidase [Planctomycetes bacterium]|nr:N-acetylmuramoyl-L-alanine amidase [Planctomycetota bacterium]
MRALSEFFDGFTGGFVGRAAAPRKAAWPAVPTSVRLVVMALGLALGLFTGIVLLIRVGAPRYAPVRKLLAPIEAMVKPEHAIFTPDLEEVLATDAGTTEREWTAIVFHHSATVAGSAQSFDAYHRTHNGWRSLGYDFVIGNGNEMPDGAIEAGPRWKAQEAGAHANSAEYNSHGIGICLVGNFDLAPPTEKQIEAARALAEALARRYRIPPSRIFGHGQIREGGGTACPGRFFPMEKVKEGLPENP